MDRISGLQPGDVVEIAEGNYVNLAIDVSGEQEDPITIKRTGDSQYAGLVQMTGIHLGSSKHVVIDGVVDDGIKLQKDNTGYVDSHYIEDSHYIHDPGAAHITLRNIEIAGPGYIECDAARGMNIAAGNLTVDNVNIHDFSSVAIRLIGNQNVMIKNSRFHNILSRGDAACQAERGRNAHFEHVAVFDGTRDVTFLGNIFSQDYSDGLAGGFAVSMAGHNGYIRYISNIFFNMGYHIYLNSDGFGDLTEYVVVGNTFAGYRVPISGSPTLLQNNVFCNLDAYFPDTNTRGASTNGSYNLYCDDDRYRSSYQSAANSQVLGPGEHPFIDYVSDWNLLSGTESGVPIASPYDKDFDGYVRGADGIWDRGAFEYTSGTAPVCGDESCNGTETCSDCPDDCGVCPRTFDLSDFIALFADWLTLGTADTDVNLDSIVNARDLGIMMSGWE